MVRVVWSEHHYHKNHIGFCGGVVFSDSMAGQKPDSPLWDDDWLSCKVRKALGKVGFWWCCWSTWFSLRWFLLALLAFKGVYRVSKSTSSLSFKRQPVWPCLLHRARWSKAYSGWSCGFWASTEAATTAAVHHISARPCYAMTRKAASSWSPPTTRHKSGHKTIWELSKTSLHLCIFRGRAARCFHASSEATSSDFVRRRWLWKGQELKAFS